MSRTAWPICAQMHIPVNGQNHNTFIPSSFFALKVNPQRLRMIVCTVTGSASLLRCINQFNILPGLEYNLFIPAYICV